MVFTTLISTSQLAARLTDPAFVVVDCRFKLADEDWGKGEYLARHIPGAVYAHLDRDLSGPKTGRNGRHPLPDPLALSDTFSRMGIAQGTQVVAYDEDSGMFASRLWWLLRWLGHDTVAVLDGGFAKWIAEGRPVRAGDEHREARAFRGALGGDAVVCAKDIAARLGQPGRLLLDARAPERFRGEVEPVDKVAGHIPGAVNYPFPGNLDERGTFRSPEDLRARLSAAIGDIPPDQVVCYCGSGVTACQNLLAFEHAGLHGVKLYPGSWSEWSSDPSRPIERS
jgi:thiosulfate/3-mercaptopyruvate sulfurtransferase